MHRLPAIVPLAHTIRASSSRIPRLAEVVKTFAANSIAGAFRRRVALDTPPTLVLDEALQLAHLIRQSASEPALIDHVLFEFKRNNISLMQPLSAAVIQAYLQSGRNDKIPEVCRTSSFRHSQDLWRDVCASSNDPRSLRQMYLNMRQSLGTSPEMKSDFAVAGRAFLSKSLDTDISLSSEILADFVTHDLSIDSEVVSTVLNKLDSHSKLRSGDSHLSPQTQLSTLLGVLQAVHMSHRSQFNIEQAKQSLNIVSSLAMHLGDMDESLQCVDLLLGSLKRLPSSDFNALLADPSALSCILANLASRKSTSLLQSTLDLNAVAVAQCHPVHLAAVCSHLIDQRDVVRTSELLICPSLLNASFDTFSSLYNKAFRMLRTDTPSTVTSFILSSCCQRDHSQETISVASQAICSLPFTDCDFIIDTYNNISAQLGQLLPAAQAHAVAAHIIKNPQDQTAISLLNNSLQKGQWQLLSLALDYDYTMTSELLYLFAVIAEQLIKNDIKVEPRRCSKLILNSITKQREDPSLRGGSESVFLALSSSARDTIASLLMRVSSLNDIDLLNKVLGLSKRSNMNNDDIAFAIDKAIRRSSHYTLSKDTTLQHPCEFLGLNLVDNAQYFPFILSSTWSSLLKTLAYSGNIQACVRMFGKLKAGNRRVDSTCYVELLRAFALRGNIAGTWQVLQQMMSANVVIDHYAYSLLFSAVASVEDAQTAWMYFLRLRKEGTKLNITSLNMLASKLVKYERNDLACKVFTIMNNDAIPPDVFNATLRMQAQLNMPFEEVRQLHSSVIEQDLEKDQAYYSTFFRACAASVRQAYKQAHMNTKYDWLGTEAVDVQGDNAHVDARQLFQEARSQPGILNLTIINHLLEICEKRGDAEFCRELRAVIDSLSLEKNYHTYNFLIGCFGRAGDLVAMDKVFAEMRASNVKPDLYIITNLIYHHGRLRDIDGAMDIYDHLVAYKMKPDSNLNDILIHVCKIDPISVVWNSMN